MMMMIIKRNRRKKRIHLTLRIGMKKPTQLMTRIAHI